MRNPQRGSAMLVTLIIIAALLGGAVVLVSMQLTSNRSSELARTGNAAMYCAEAGLAAARPTVASSQTSWAASLAVSATGDTTEPSWLAAGIGSHDLDGDTVADFEVYILDNDDETSTTNDRAVDVDNRIFIVSRCKKYGDTPKEVRELIEYVSQTGTCYESQEGGCSQQGNAN
ncbi:MAG TPA: hypothetical protein VL326_38365 [Kofleriaceae bacterium]|nr:hypothetical protein [Kofleriaceae bacterium]